MGATFSHGMLSPQGSPAEVQRIWQEYDESKATLSFLVIRSLDSPNDLSKSFYCVLAPEVEMAMEDDQSAPFVWCNMDANGMRNRSKANDGSTLQTYSGGYSSYHRNGSHGGQQAGPLTPLDIQRMEEENVGLQQQTQLIPDQDYLRERADAMSTVETNIVELGTIFNKLAVMVNEHKEMVQRVEDNVDDANSTINLSLNTLTDVLANLQTNRALFFKVFGILVAFIVMFIVFFA